MANIAKIQKSIKRKAQPATPQTPVTPTVKESPHTPSTSKKPKLSFKTGSKAKRLLPKTPKQKTPKSKTKLKTPSPTFSTAEEEEDFAAESPWEKAKESIKKSFNEAAKRAQERALKKKSTSPWVETVWNTDEKKTPWERLVIRGQRFAEKGDNEGASLNFKN